MKTQNNQTTKGVTLLELILTIFIIAFTFVASFFMVKLIMYVNDVGLKTVLKVIWDGA